MYNIVFSDDAKKDLQELRKKAPEALPKLAKLLNEVREHPRTGNRSPGSFHLWPLWQVSKVSAPFADGWFLHDQPSAQKVVLRVLCP